MAGKIKFRRRKEIMAAPEYEYEVWEKKRRTNANEPGKLEAGKFVGKKKES